MALTYKISELMESEYQVIGKSKAYVTKFGTTYILSLKHILTNAVCQVWSNAYLTEYIGSNQIPAGGFKITIKKDVRNNSIVDIENYSRITLF